MKTLTHIFGLLLLLSGSVLSGQSLNIKGKFNDKKGEKLNVHYVLCAGMDTILTGQDDKLKSKLSLNRDYFLTITLEGYQTKTIWFATYTDLNETFSFVFDVELDKEPRTKMSPLTVVMQNNQGATVYFDQQKGDFDYSRN